MGGLALPAVDLRFTIVAPLIALAIGALLVLVIDLLLPQGKARVPGLWVAAGGVLLSGYYLVSLWQGWLPTPADAAQALFQQGFAGAVLLDRFSLATGGVLLLTALLAIMLTASRREDEVPGFLALLMWSTMGMLTMVIAGNLMTLFLGLEILSLGLYVMVAFAPNDQRGREGALKYLVLGSVATAFFLYGSALLYGETGSTGFGEMHAYVNGLAGGLGVYYKTGVGLLLVGLAFKLALAPFHTWAPDAYQGAPTPVTAFMSAGTKTAAFAATLRLLAALLPAGAVGAKLLAPMLLLGMISMFVGSLAAIPQTNMKRLLAYSGVAHVGYLMMALVGLSQSGATAGVFYLYAYALMNIGALAVVIYLDQNGQDGADITTYQGLVYRHPWLGAAMALFMLSLTGMPPAAGFVGKLQLMRAALDQGGTLLVAALVTTTGISAFAYLRVVLTMFARVEKSDTMVQGKAEVAAASVGLADRPGSLGSAWAVALVIAIAAAGTLILGLHPQPLMQALSQLLPLA